MMVADFAYGLILCLVSGIALMVGNFSESTRKFLKFFFALSFSTMIWGLLYGSAFGDLIKLPTQVLDSSKDFMSILILSVIFGAVHLVIGLAIKAYVLTKNGHFMDAIYDVFLWYLTLASLIMLILAGKFGFSEFTKKILIVCAVVGMLGIVAFGARDAETLMGRIGGGIYSLYGVTSYRGFCFLFKAYGIGFSRRIYSRGYKYYCEDACKWRDTWNYTWNSDICIWTGI